MTETEQTDTQDDKPSIKQQSPKTWLIGLVLENILSITVVSVLLVGLVGALGWFTLPRPVVLSGTVFIVSGLVGLAIIGPYARRYLPDYPKEYIIDIALTNPQEATIVQIPSGTIEDWTITEGQVHNPVSGLYFVSALDVEDMELEGTWRGEFSDRELAAVFSRISEQRQQFREDARKGRRLRDSLPLVVRNIVSQEAATIRDLHDDLSLPDGSSVQDTIDSMLNQDDHLEPEDVLDDDLDRHDLPSDDQDSPDSTDDSNSQPEQSATNGTKP
jgi:hypothetical protein